MFGLQSQVQSSNRGRLYLDDRRKSRRLQARMLQCEKYKIRNTMTSAT